MGQGTVRRVSEVLLETGIPDWVSADLTEWVQDPKPNYKYEALCMRAYSSSNKPYFVFCNIEMFNGHEWIKVPFPENCTRVWVSQAYIRSIEFGVIEFEHYMNK